MVFAIFQTVVVPASEVTFEDEEPGGHIVVTVGDNRTSSRIAKICRPKTWLVERSATFLKSTGKLLLPRAGSLTPCRDPLEVERRFCKRGEIRPLIGAASSCFGNPEVFDPMIVTTRLIVSSL